MAESDSGEGGSPTETPPRRKPREDGARDGCAGALADGCLSVLFDVGCSSCLTAAFGCLLPLGVILIAVAYFAAPPLVHFLAAVLSGSPR